MNDLPPELEKRVQALVNLYGSTQKALEAAIISFGFDDLQKLTGDMNGILDKLDTTTAFWVSNSVWRIVVFETRRAERLINGPKLTISQAVMDKINRGYYQTFAQQNAQIRDNLNTVLNRGYVRGATLEDRRAFQQAVVNQGITGIIRSDGSRMSVAATGKAMVRTRTLQLQNETHLERYRAGGVEEVDILVEEGICNLDPPCDSYKDEEPYPIDEAPELPLHLYCRCRYVPVLK